MGLHIADTVRVYARLLPGIPYDLSLCTPVRCSKTKGLSVVVHMDSFDYGINAILISQSILHRFQYNGSYTFSNARAICIITESSRPE
ncbi:hypothetical protein D3C73_1186210 [compost metagenome]